MSKSVLIVDNSPEMIEMISLHLRRERDVEVHAVTSGEDALAVLEQQHFDLVLLDVLLPRVDGFEVCRRIKNHPKTMQTKVIFLTGFDVSNILTKCKEVGADEVILKPFGYESLFRAIDKHTLE